MNQYQVTYNIVNVPIEVINAKQSEYANIPDWQREGGVWPLYRKQRFINTILRGGYVPQIVAFRRPQDGKLCIIDGQQRLNTIFAFIGGAFQTASHSRGAMKVIESKRFYNELTDGAKQRFQNFALSFAILQEGDEVELMETYRDMQNLTPLQKGDHLKAFRSKTQDLAFSLLDNMFFSSICTATNKTNIHLFIAYIPILAELSSPFSMYSSDRFELVANGQLDDSITEHTSSKIEERLFYVVSLFDGVTSSKTNALIPMYQAVYLLLLAGYNLNASKHGCLTDWYHDSVASKHMEDRYQNVTNDNFSAYLANFHKRGFQLSFWGKYLLDLATLPGLVAMEDSQQKIIKIATWCRNNGYCNRCGESIKLEQCLTHDCTTVAPVSPAHVLH